MRSILTTVLIFTYSILFSLFALEVPASAHDVKEVKIGVLALRGEEVSIRQWQATGDYLTSKIPGYNFRIVPLGFDEILDTSINQELDFYLVNPAFYVNLERKFGVERLATVSQRVENIEVTRFAAVIFTRALNTNIQTLKDLKGKKFAAVDQNSFGGWLLGKYELLKNGFKPELGFKSLTFKDTHDAVVNSVLSGENDAGVVRSGTLEQMDQEGLIQLNEVKLIHQKKDPFFLHLHSTDLFPEWPISAARRTSPELSKKVAVALLQMQPESLAAKQALISGWSVPDNYSDVHDILKVLKHQPYENWGEVSFVSAFNEYGVWVILLVTINLAMLGFLFLKLKRILRQKKILENNQSGLSGTELQVSGISYSLFLISSSLLGAASLTILSAIQKIIVGVSLNPKGFIIPLVFGSVSGLLVGFFFHRVLYQRESIRLKAHALTASVKKYNRLFDLLPYGGEMIASDGTILEFSKSGALMLGYQPEEIIGRHIKELLEPEYHHLIDSSLQDISTFHIRQREVKMICKDGSRLDILRTETPVREDESLFQGLLCANVNITGLKEAQKEKEILQEQLNHNRRLDALGQLAGGVAHDFNNLLAGIMAAAQYLGSPKRNLNEKEKKFVEMILQASTRAANLTAKLLTFSRKDVKKVNDVDIHKVINDSVDILRNTLDKKIKVSITKDAEIKWCIGDYSALQNVLINMGVNASHAMPDGGEIGFSTRNLKLSDVYCQNSPFDLSPGCHIEIEVRDTGLGMSREIQEKIFEPFFTTKEQGAGTGLGLATVYGTIKEHNGAIKVYSEEGVGTVFHILLPCKANSLEQPYIEESVIEGEGRLLLVDDEEMIRIVQKQLLEEIGYEVDVAENGRHAVELYQTSETGYDLVILDMIMPELNGEETFYQLKKLDENVKVIISSGFTKEEQLVELKTQGLQGFINKPYRDYELSKMIHDVLKNK